MVEYEHIVVKKGVKAELEGLKPVGVTWDEYLRMLIEIYRKRKETGV